MYFLKNNKQPQIHDSCFIAPNATLIGDVQCGINSSVWFQAVIRADVNQVIIGECVNIQDACVLHVDEDADIYIGDYVTVGHGCILHGCHIDNNVLVGMGATIMNHVRIGQNSIVGAGALITEGTVIPENSLVMGMPGKVKRNVTDNERDMIISSAKRYASVAESYRNA